MFVATSSVEADLKEKGFARMMRWSRGVDLELYRPRSVRLFGEQPVFLYVGRIAIEKNIKAFLDLDLPGRKVVVGTGLRYDPISIEDAKYTAYMNREREPGWFRNRRMRDVDFSVLPLGEKQFAGVLYNIYTFSTSPAPNVLMLSGFGSDVKADSVEGIRVDRRADALLFLHTYNPEKKAEQYDDELAEFKARPLGKAKREDMPEPPHVLTYVVRYADGKTEEIEVNWREDIGPWFRDQPRDLKNAALAWTAPIPETEGWKLAAYSMQWNNPRRDVAIESIDLQVPDPQQTQGYGAPALLAITAATALE
jgi:hypothetical protein